MSISSGSPTVSGLRQRSGVKPKKLSFLTGNRITRKQLAVYTRQLATLLHAGVPIVQALRVLLKQDSSPLLSNILQSQIDQVESGNALSTSMRRHPKVFDSMYIHLVVAGEKAGVLDQVLDRLALYLERNIQTAGKVKSAMTYPVVVLIASVAIVTALLVFVVPQFEEIFENMLQGAPLPLMTQWVLAISVFFQKNWPWILGGIGGFWILGNLLSRIEFIRRVVDAIVLRIPIWGNMIHYSMLARFSRTLGTLLESAVPILEAMDTAARTLNNSVIESVFQRVRMRVVEGDQMASPMDNEQKIPPMMIGMVEVGEATGELPSMLIQVAETYEQEVEVTIDGLTTLIEPIMILILAVIIGFLVIALFLPIVEIMQQLSI